VAEGEGERNSWLPLKRMLTFSKAVSMPNIKQGRNFVKCKSFGVLLEASERAVEGDAERYAWLSGPDIAKRAGVSAGSLGVLLGRWVGWRYVLAHSFKGLLSDRRCSRLYRIAARGKRYYEAMPKWYGRYTEAQAEVIGLGSLLERGELSTLWVEISYLYWVREPLPVVLAIKWPFEGEGDIQRVFGTRYIDRWDIQVKDRESAFIYAERYFGIRPSSEFKLRVQALEANYVQGELRRLGLTQSNKGNMAKKLDKEAIGHYNRG